MERGFAKRRRTCWLASATWRASLRSTGSAHTSAAPMERHGSRSGTRTTGRRRAVTNCSIGWRVGSRVKPMVGRDVQLRARSRGCSSRDPCGRAPQQIVRQQFSARKLHRRRPHHKSVVVPCNVEGLKHSWVARAVRLCPAVFRVLKNNHLPRLRQPKPGSVPSPHLGAHKLNNASHAY